MMTFGMSAAFANEMTLFDIFTLQIQHLAKAVSI